MRKHEQLVILDSLYQDALAEVVKAENLAYRYKEEMNNFRHKWYIRTVPCRSYDCLEKIDDNCPECGGYGRTDKLCSNCRFYKDPRTSQTTKYCYNPLNVTTRDDLCTGWEEWSSATCPWCRYRPGKAGCEGKPVRGMLCPEFKETPDL